MDRFKRKVGEIKQLSKSPIFKAGDRVWHPQNGVELRIVVETDYINETPVMSVAELEQYSIPSLPIVQEGWSLCK
jgi:hypothetical protein